MSHIIEFVINFVAIFIMLVAVDYKREVKIAQMSTEDKICIYILVICAFAFSALFGYLQN